MRTLVSASTLLEWQGQKSHLVVVDCRFSLADPAQGEIDYQTAHIPGSVYLHLERDLSGPVVPGVTGRHPLPSPEQLARRLEAAGISSDSTVIAYDSDHGAFAARLWWLLRWLGHNDVAVLDGGFAGWCESGLPTSSSVQEPRTGKFSVNLKPEMIVTALQVEEMRHETNVRIFDARSADRFRGENETIDPVSGHIPGAQSLPFMNNLQQGKLRPHAELRRYFEGALGDVPADKAVVYCGSGVTACHNLLALEHAGFEGAKLYPGSWSEWITDPNRPIARGG